MTSYNERLDEILFNLCDLSYASFTTQEEADRVADQLDYDRAEAKQAITSLIKELVEEAIGEDESLVEVHKRNLVVASQFNAVIKSRNSLRHKQRQALKNLLKALEEV